MKVTIEREVTRCSNCPCFSEMSDMGGMIYVCSKLGIMHNATYYSIDKINDNCPFKKSNQKRMTKEEVLKLIDETHQDFVDCQGGHTSFIFEDKIYETDTGYAMDGIEAFVMGKKYDYDQFRRDFLDLKSSFWISATVDTSELQEKLDGIALTCQGKVLFVNDFDSIADCFAEIERYVSQDSAHNKTIIREYCQKNIELLNNQIRLLNQDKYMYSELLNTI